MGTRYTNLSSAPRWFKKTLLPVLRIPGTTRFTLFFLLFASGVAASVWAGSHGPLLLSVTFLCILIAGLLSVVFTDLYGKPCDASHKGKPWVIEEGTFETSRNVHHQAVASPVSPVSTGLPKTHQSSREAYSEVLEHDGDDGRSGPYYRDYSSAPYWLRKTLFPTLKPPDAIMFAVFIFFFPTFLFFATLFHGAVAVTLFFIASGIIGLLSEAFKHLYGKQCDASHKGKPWVIEYYEGGGYYGGGGGGCGGGGGGGCGGGGCGGD